MPLLLFRRPDAGAALQLAKSATKEPELRNEIKSLKQQIESLEEAQGQVCRF
jgi:transcription initiation factor IIE alpha subunit